MSHTIIEITFHSHSFQLPAFDPDCYSVIELMRDYTEAVRRQSINLPVKPTFFYKHPKSGRYIEICNDQSLMNMFKVLSTNDILHLNVRDALNHSCLMDMWVEYMRNQGVSGEQVEILPSSPPPATQPSTQPPSQPTTIPQRQHVLTPQDIQPQIISSSTTAKRKHKKKVPRGLNTSFQLAIVPILPEINIPPVNIQPLQNSSSGDAPPQSAHTSNTTPRSSDVNASSVQLDHGDGSAVGDDPTYSDDSWCHKDDDDDAYVYETDSTFSDDHDLYEDDRLEDCEDITDTGYYSADDEDCSLTEASYLRNGTHFEYEANGSVVFKPHQMFENKKAFLEVIRDYACQEGIDLHRTSNDPFKYTAKCNNTDTCPWRLHASLLPDKTTFMVKTLRGEHNCVRITKNPNATVPWITKKILPDIRANKKLIPRNIMDIMKEKYSVDLSYMQCYRAKNLALKIIEGNHDESYAKIPQYCMLALERNPGSIIDLHYQEYLTSPPTFTRLFVCFHAQKQGFLHGCRPFIGVDGCHLKGPYGGVLLTAVSIDGNNGIFPLAFAVVQSESTNTWKYFFNQLKKIADIDTRKKWVIISDRQKGVEPALRDELPEITRRICCRHLYANFKKDYSGPLMRNLFWEAAKAYTERSLDSTLNKIRENSVSAFNYLKNVDFDLWVRYHMPKHTKMIAVTSNFVESFNSRLFDIRTKPILAMLDELRRSMMIKMHKRRDDSLKLREPITVYATKMLLRNNKSGRSCGIKASSDIEFEVTDVGGYFIVNLRDHHCDCMAWDYSGIPCKHACVVICKQRLDLRAFVAPCYSREMYIATYNNAISPIPDPNVWPNIDTHVLLRPPFLRKLPGRPKKNRRREQGEAPPVGKRSTHITCKICKQIGHNSLTCRSQKDRGNGPNGGVAKGKRKRPATKKLPVDHAVVSNSDGTAASKV